MERSKATAIGRLGLLAFAAWVLYIAVLAVFEKPIDTPPAGVVLPDDQKQFEGYLVYASNEKDRLLDQAKDMTSIQAAPLLDKVESLDHPSPPKNMQGWSCYVWDDISDVGDQLRVDCKGKADAYYRLTAPATFHDALMKVNKGDWITFSGSLESISYGENQIPIVRNDRYNVIVSSIQKSQ